MCDDPFAAALGEDWCSEDDGEVCHVEPASSAADVKYKAAEEKAAPQKRGPGRPAKTKQAAKGPRKIRKGAPVTSELQLMEPAGDPKDNNLHVVFINSAEKAKSGQRKCGDAGPKRPGLSMNPG